MDQKVSKKDQEIEMLKKQIADMKHEEARRKSASKAKEMAIQVEIPVELADKAKNKEVKAVKTQEQKNDQEEYQNSDQEENEDEKDEDDDKMDTPQKNPVFDKYVDTQLLVG